MKNFREWLEEKDLNEISSDLLDRAAKSAGERGDLRGTRLFDKFNAASVSRSSFQIKGVAKLAGGTHELSLNIKRMVPSINDRDLAKGVKLVTINIDAQLSEQLEHNSKVLQAGYNCPIKIVLNLNNMKSSAKIEVNGLENEIYFDRMSANLLAKNINAKNLKFASGEEIKINPTMLPMV